MPYYIGIDGGGTKTAYALFNEKKEILFRHEGPGSNHENLAGAYDEAAALLREGVQALLDGAGIALGDVAFTFAGLAGVDHPFQYDIMMGLLTGMGLARLEIVNDGFIAVKAGCGSGAGVGLNLGTGTVCSAIDRQGRCVQLAGLGEFSGDVGNGQWIIMQVFRCVYDELFLGLEPTALTPLLFKEFGLSEPGDIMPLIPLLDCEGGNDTKRAFVRLFFEALNVGDAPALLVAERMAERGAQLVAAQLNTLDFADPVEIVLAGSIHTKLPNDVYLELLALELEQLSGRAFVFSKLAREPVMGCIDWIMERYV